MSGSPEVPVRSRPRRVGAWLARVAGEDEARVAIDLSAGGAFVRDLVAHAPGASFELELLLEDGPVTVRATVRWVRATDFTVRMPAGAGVAFEGLSDDVSCRIARAAGGGGS